MPRPSSLFPSKNADALPDVSSLELSPLEYNKMAYEQLLLSTRMLRDVPDKEDADTIINAVRVQLHIPQAEHDLMMKVLRANEKGADETESSASASHSAAASSSDAMPLVNYRLTLLRTVKSSRFPTLQLYRAWFKRQVHAVWLAIVWTMKAQVSASKHAAAAAGGGDASLAAGSSSLSLTRFKQTLQLVQLLSFTLSCKVDTKLFAHGDAVADDAHRDLQQQLQDLEAVLLRFPAPHGDAKSKTLVYPQLLLNRIYTHVVHVSCIAGGDEAGLPLTVAHEPSPERSHNDGSDDDDDDDSDDDEDEESIRLHSNYLHVLSCLSSVRARWSINDFQHGHALLRLVLHVLYYQSLDFDGRMLDADAMLLDDAASGGGGGSAEGSALPLLAYISYALTAGKQQTPPTELRELVAASSSSSSSDPGTDKKPKRVKPERMEEEESRFLLFALRNIGYALSDFQRFQAKPVTVWSAHGQIAAHHVTMPACL